MSFRSIGVLSASLVAAILVIWWLSWWNDVNYGGPRVPDASRILAAADAVARNDLSIQVQRPLANGKVMIENRNTITYANGADLMARNPACCRISRPSLSDSARCVSAYDVVSVRYVARYLDEAGAIKSKRLERELAVDRAGQVCPPAH